MRAGGLFRTTRLLLCFFLQDCLEAEFLYLGLRFGYLKTRIKVCPPTILFVRFTNNEFANCEEIRDAIKADVRDMNQTEMGGKKGYTANGSFKKLVGLDKNVYVYHHTQHATCSGTTFTQLSTCLTMDPTYCSEDGIRTCSSSSCHHHILLPFFMGNKAVLMRYKELKRKNDSLIEQGEVEELEEIVHNRKDCLNTLPCSSFIAKQLGQKCLDKETCTFHSKTISRDKSDIHS